MDLKTFVIFNLLLTYRRAFLDAPEEIRMAVENVLYAISSKRALDPADLARIKEFARFASSAPGPELLDAIEDFERGLSM